MCCLWVLSVRTNLNALRRWLGETWAEVSCDWWGGLWNEFQHPLLGISPRCSVAMPPRQEFWISVACAAMPCPCLFNSPPFACDHFLTFECSRLGPGFPGNEQTVGLLQPGDSILLPYAPTPGTLRWTHSPSLGFRMTQLQEAVQTGASTGELAQSH